MDKKGLNRRHFMKIGAASAAVAATTGFVPGMAQAKTINKKK